MYMFKFQLLVLSPLGKFSNSLKIFFVFLKDFFVQLDFL